jgi:glutathione S-transferase
MRLHSFCQSGNAFKVALMLNVLGVKWEPVFVDFMNGQTRDPAWRATVNAMGEAPVLEDGEVKLTQSGVILDYLAQKFNQFGGRDDAQKREVLRWMFFDNHKFTSYFATYRFAKSFGPQAPDPALMNWLRGRVDVAHGIVNAHLAKQDWMAGDAPTIADFSLCGYVFYPPEESGIDIRTAHPHIGAWMQRLEALPNFVPPYDLLPGEQIAPKW